MSAGARVLVISGPMGAGKTTLAQGLVDRHGALRVSTRELLLARLGERGGDRRSLQEAGAALDRETDGRWVADSVKEFLGRQQGPPRPLIVDSVRIASQIEALRRALGAQVMHVHVSAPAQELEARYERRRSHAVSDPERASFGEARADTTERGVEGLAEIADLVLDTQRHSAEAVTVQAACLFGLFGRDVERLVDVLVGGQYGSEGKGQIAAFLAPEYDVLVRVGGPNAGHRVYEELGHYTFHQLPSGTRAASRARVVLGPGSTLSLRVLHQEIADCRLEPGRLFIDPHALVIEPSDVTFEEESLRKQIASTARGVGAATARKVLRTAAEPPVRLAKDLKELGPFLRPTREVLEDAYARGGRVLVEGTQGAGLSLHHGDYPYVTSRDTTASGCLAEAGIAPGRVRKTLLVCRTYPIRVQNPDEGNGTSGPMAGELSWEEIARRSGLPLDELRTQERTSTTNRQRRVSEFDWVLLRKAASLNAPTDVVLTFLDYLSASNRSARRFAQLTPEAHRFIEGIERVAQAPVSLLSMGWGFRHILDRRLW
ncbi:adenylosuccinate synthase [Stigmatella aurantiaca]|uniref:Adenylosuccinate synthetase n=1 Tax=Stigmatella aurantiaca TaxID=41 RepID=A0A1H7Y9W0_STIAU|nr:adenylosuccinate synthetase [Stigmatella aurantiaca]SEM42910.1 adenylosuccinate synthase [Stigmatella aurantiaca]